MIQNLYIIVYEITVSHIMFVPNLSGDSGKTVQKNPYIVMMEYISLPIFFLMK